MRSDTVRLFYIILELSKHLKSDMALLITLLHLFFFHSPSPSAASIPYLPLPFLGDPMP